MQFGDERAHLVLLAVAPALRRRGIGRRMLAWLTESAQVAGVMSIHVELRAQNHAAHALYRTAGFAESLRIPGYYSGRETAVRMLRLLRSPQGRMKALQKTRPAFGAELRDVPPPDAPAEGEVIVAVGAACVCGSDLHIYEWTPGYAFMAERDAGDDRPRVRGPHRRRRGRAPARWVRERWSPCGRRWSAGVATRACAATATAAARAAASA